MPDPGAGGGETAGSTSSSTVSSQLAYLVPSFDPSKDDLLVYQQKVELITAAWPPDKYVELITRLVLNCQGSAFQKLQIHHSELINNDRKSIERLIELLGGSWGRIPLEKQFDEAEQALFHCHQKVDESNDSYLARSEILWSKLLARKIRMEDIQAFIVLRGSTLAAEDKKRVILESDKEQSGSLTMKRVAESIRLLGASFFMDVTGQKRGKTKVYDQTALMMEDQNDINETMVTEEITEEEFVEALIADGEDSDAALIADFESTAQDLLQDDPDLSLAFTAYTDARKRLSEKFRNRGFFPTSRSAASNMSGKGKGFGGRFQGKGGKGFRSKRSLQDRILNSTCRACGRKGHWKAECPYNKGSVGTSSTTGTSMPTTTLVTEETGSDLSRILPMEFLQVPRLDEADSLQQCPIDEPRQPMAHVFGVFHDVLPTSSRERLKQSLEHYQGKIQLKSGEGNARVDQLSPRRNLRARMLRSEKTPEPRNRNQPDRSHFGRPVPKPRMHKPITQMTLPKVQEQNPGNVEDAQICFASHGAAGILDLGASKTVIGSEHVATLIKQLEPEIRSRLRRCPCEITFRFGNQATLTSSQALVIPIGPPSLKIAIVPGGTPFLLSNTLMRAIHASIDCRSHEMHSPMFSSPVKLQLSSRGLFLIDINELTQACQPAKSLTVKSTPLQETFVSDDVEKEVLAEPMQVNIHEESQPGHMHISHTHSSEVDKPHPCSPSRHESTFPRNVTTKIDVPASNVDSPEHQPDVTQYSEIPTKVEASASDSVQARDSSDPSANSCSDRGSHVNAPRSTASPASAHRSGSTRPEPPHTGRIVSGEDLLRPEVPRKTVCRSLEGSRMGELHGEALWQQHEVGAQEVPEVCRLEGDPARDPPEANPGSATGQCAQASQCQGQQPRHGTCGQVQGPRGFLANSPPPRYGGGRMVHGVRWGTRDVHLSDYDLKWNPGHGSNAATSPQHGERPHQGDPSPGDATGHGSTSDDLPGIRDGLKEDWEADVFTVMPSEIIKLKNLVQKFEKELVNTHHQVRPMGKPITLIEVFCTEQSPLTHQVNQLGQKAMRFGYSEADLSTSEGRFRLFSSLIRHRPKHVWVSPDCGPWSSWTQLNESKSLESQQEYAMKREQLLYQLALCIVLFRHQIQVHQEFHWEQPAKSLML